MALTKAHNRMVADAPINVIDFGASASGVDSTTEIQAAFTALQDGGQIVFPKGDYLVSDSITVSAQDVTVLAYGSTIEQTGANKKTLNFTDPGAAKVFGGKFVGKGTEHDGASTSYNGVAALYFNGPEGVIVDGVVCNNHAGGAIRYINADGLTVRNSTIVGIGTAGGISSLDNNNDFAIGSSGSTADNKVLIDGCDISGHCFGIGASRGTSLRVVSCHIHSIPGQHGIYGSSCSDMIVTGCRFRDIEGEGIKNQIAVDSSNLLGVVIDGNTFREIGQAAIVIGPTSVVTGSSFSNIVIDNNSIYSVGTYFISIRDGSGVIGDNNDMESNSGGYGIIARGFTGRIGKSKISLTEWSGIYLEADGDVEVDPRLYDCCRDTAGTGSGTDVTTYMYVTKKSGVSGTPKVLISSGEFKNTLSLPSGVTTCIRCSSDVAVSVKGFDNEIQKAWRFDNPVEIGTNYSTGADFTVSATQNPSTPIYGRGRRVLYGTQDPATASMTDKFIPGDICFDATPSAGGKLGWVCVTGGTPGTWKAFGAIDS